MYIKTKGEDFGALYYTSLSFYNMSLTNIVGHSLCANTGARKLYKGSYTVSYITEESTMSYTESMRSRKQIIIHRLKRLL